MKAYTDYPFTFLGDVEGLRAPIREIEVLDYDGDKYCNIVVEGHKDSIKSGYIYNTPGRSGEVPCITRRQLHQLERVK